MSMYKATLKYLNKRILQFQERFLRNTWVLGTPFHLVLETGNICNLKCPLCPTPTRENRIPKGQLTLENAKRIIDRFPLLYHINMSLWGEPFLNSEIFEIIKYAKSKGVEVLVQSNLNVFDREKAHNVIASGLDILQISLDGASQEPYEKYRVRGDFNRVIENIKLIKELQKEQNNFQTTIIWKMVVNKFNEHEVEKAQKWAHDLGVKFLLVEIYTPAHLEKNWKPLKGVEESEIVHTDEVQSCYSLWQVTVVNFNGDVFPCCSEFSPQDAIGNIFKEPFSHIWNSKKIRRLRKANKKRINCRACHIDKKTGWYKLWMAQENNG